eukprot:5187395-Amphidinium_carterae.1
MQTLQRNIMTNILPCPFETRNMSVGCSAVVIQAGSCRGLAKWLPRMHGALPREAAATGRRSFFFFKPAMHGDTTST